MRSRIGFVILSATVTFALAGVLSSPALAEDVGGGAGGVGDGTVGSAYALADSALATEESAVSESVYASMGSSVSSSSAASTASASSTAAASTASASSTAAVSSFSSSSSSSSSVPASASSTVSTSSASSILQPEGVPTAITSIATSADLVAFGASVDAGMTYAGQTVDLIADIDMTGVTWDPIGSVTGYQPENASVQASGAFFEGTFNGNGHTISGLDSANLATAQDDVTALFACVGTGGMIDRLNVSVSLEAPNAVAGITGLNYGTISSCTFAGSLHSDEKETNIFYMPALSGTGGIVAINFGTVSGCSSVAGASIYRGGSIEGGIVGINYGTVEGCENHAGLTSGDTLYPMMYTTAGGVGGIVGNNSSLFDSNDTLFSEAIVRSCVNHASFGGVQYVGGIVGISMDGSCSDCSNEGEITCDKSNAGGIVAYLYQAHDKASSIRHCSNSGAIHGNVQVGGICGYLFFMIGSWGGAIANQLTLEDCLNTGVVDGSNLVGGDVGKNEGDMSRCFNTASVTAAGTGNGQDMVGGVAGASPGRIFDCGNIGDVRYTRTDYPDGVMVGGIAGTCSYTGTIDRSYNLGHIVIDADVDFEDLYIYPGGVAGMAVPDNVTDSYYCAERAGDATSLVPSDEDAPAGTPLVDMVNQRALTGMSGLFSAGSGSAWTAGGPWAIDPESDRVTVTPPYLTSAYMDEHTAAIADIQCYKVTLPQGEGYAVAPVGDAVKVLAADLTSQSASQDAFWVLPGGDFTFTVQIADGYKADNLIVKSNGIVLVKGADGSYTIAGIESDQQVTIEGVEKVVTPTPAPTPSPTPAPGQPGTTPQSPSQLPKTGDAMGMPLMLGLIGMMTGASLFGIAFAVRKRGRRRECR